MANKTLLVAKREYIENVRTKTFWVGILMFPVIWAVALTVPALLQKTKSVKNYAVVDETANSWFMNEFERRTEVPNLGKMYGDWKKGTLAEEPALPDSLRVQFARFKEGEEKRGEPLEAGRLNMMFQAMQSLGDVTDEQLDQIGPYLSMMKALFAKLPTHLVDKALAKTGASRAEVEQAIEKGEFSVDNLKKMRDDSRALVSDAKGWWRAMAESENEEVQQRARRYLSTNTLGRFERVPSAPEDALRKQLDGGGLFAYFVVPKDPVGARPEKKAAPTATPKKDGDKPSNGEGAEPEKEPDPTLFKYVTKKENLADRDLREWFSKQAKEIVRERRLVALDIDNRDADWLAANIRFSEKQVTAGGTEEKVEKSDVIGQFAPIAFVYLLWISVFTIANLLLTNTIEEKSNRLIEVLLSSVSPLQLMMGKILGLAGTGLTMVASWAFFAVLGIKIAPLFGENIAANIADWGLSEIILNPRYLGSFIIYFVFGYLLYAALLVGIGSVCNSLKEAQNLMQPVILLLIVPLLAMFPIAQEPNGTMAKVMSYIPPFTPFVMMNRAGGPPSLLEYGVTTALLIATVVFAIIFAAKIFRIGILMTGKPPKVREIFGWLRAPVGTVYVRDDEQGDD